MVYELLDKKYLLMELPFREDLTEEEITGEKLQLRSLGCFIIKASIVKKTRRSYPIVIFHVLVPEEHVDHMSKTYY